MTPETSSRHSAVRAIMARAESLTEDGDCPSAQLIVASAVALLAAVFDQLQNGMAHSLASGCAGAAGSGGASAGGDRAPAYLRAIAAIDWAKPGRWSASAAARPATAAFTAACTSGENWARYFSPVSRPSIRFTPGPRKRGRGGAACAALAGASASARPGTSPGTTPGASPGTCPGATGAGTPSPTGRGACACPGACAGASARSASPSQPGGGLPLSRPGSNG